MLRPEHVYDMQMLGLERACMSLVLICIVSHNLFTIIYKIRVYLYLF
jgi:hypothetical protein